MLHYKYKESGGEEMSLGKRLRKLRDKHNWTLQQVANKLELTGLSTYSNWEYDRTEPSLEMVNKLAVLYKVDVGYLLTGRGHNEIDYNYNLKELLNGINVKWDEEVLSEEEKDKAIQLLTVLLGKN